MHSSIVHIILVSIMYLSQILKSLDDLSPSWLSLTTEKYQGLCFGRKTDISSIVIRKALITVTPTVDCIDEAINTKVNLIISHHALYIDPFFEIKELAFEKFRLLTEHNIWVFFIGNSWNAASQGITESTCQALKLKIEDALEIVNQDGLAVPIGRICVPEGAFIFGKFLEQVKTMLPGNLIRYGGKMENKPSKILVIGGVVDSINTIARMLQEKIEMIISGEFSPDVRNALVDLNLNFIELSHHMTDVYGMSKLKLLLSLKHPNVNFELYDKEGFHYL